LSERAPLAPGDGSAPSGSVGTTPLDIDERPATAVPGAVPAVPFTGPAAPAAPVPAAARDPWSRSGTENFPVAARILPRRVRADLQAIYVYARWVDDLGDEADGDRLALLDGVDTDLTRLYTGAAPLAPPVAGLADLVRRGLPREVPAGLVAANRQDQTVTAYATVDELVAYCRLSADPVGRFVLHAFDAATPENERLSDSVCTALQFLEHWQDVAEDRARGRVYLPAADLARFDVTDADLLAATASHGLRALLAFETARAVRMLDEGAPLVGRLHGWARVAVSGFVAGGYATAKALADARFDVLTSTPTPGRAATVATWAGLWTGRAGGGPR
jgi:squalene synthase HpnC